MEFYAIKKLKYNNLLEQEIADNEIKMMLKIRKLNCKSLIQLEQKYRYNGNLFLILEYGRCSLSDVLETGQTFNEI